MQAADLLLSSSWTSVDGRHTNKKKTNFSHPYVSQCRAHLFIRLDASRSRTRQPVSLRTKAHALTSQDLYGFWQSICQRGAALRAVESSGQMKPAMTTRQRSGRSHSVESESGRQSGRPGAGIST